MDDGLLAYMGSLDDSAQWRARENILWGDPTVREKVFYEIFKGFEPAIEYKGPKAVDEEESFTITLTFKGFWNGITRERRNAAGAGYKAPAVEGKADITFINRTDTTVPDVIINDIPVTGGEAVVKGYPDVALAPGIYDVKVTSTPGMLTDHYNPANKTVNLSEGVYGSCSVAAAAVAAHECGHALQHARAYAPLKMRSALVPVVQFSSSIVSWVLLAGILMVQSMPQILLAGIVLFAASTLFSFITLPVEINASGRALAWMSNAGITNAFNHKAAEDALKSAEYTYVVAALSSLATLIYYVSIYMGRRE